MGVKVGNNANLQWQSPINQHHNQLPWKKTRCTLVFRPEHRTTFVGTTRRSTGGLFRSKSMGSTNMILNSPPSSSIRRSSSSKIFDTSFFSSKDDYEENDFIRKLQELKIGTVHVNEERNKELPSSSSVDTKPPWWFGINKSIIEGNNQLLGDIRDEFVNRNASNVDLPMSLQMIKKKRKMEETSHIIPSISSSCSTLYYDSVKKAFSSMVFIIRELNSYILQLREVLLDGIGTNNHLSEVHKEMHASFCWLFQQIFSCTPTLMVSIMLLLANFTVNSMATVTDNYNHMIRYEMSSIAATIEQQETQQHLKESEKVCDAKKKGDNAKNSLLKKQNVAMDMDSLLRMAAPTSMQNYENGLEDELLYAQTLTKYFQTDLIYQEAVRDNPENSMYLCNYAQFLYVVKHDHDRAEQYFKRAVEIIPVDAENLSRYANFLWMAKNNLCAAEEMYLTAIEIDPNNASHASNYANFLWNTSGEDDTCFSLQACPMSSSKLNTIH
ncbi:hypothetical protein ZOSMA_239G00060 [Zostera marina]|uniref:Uncharacterized protein n=1 Tax=Zostera marina TaxID=29655 RepID=A0A0K9PJT5_ZOSMR|nr:hypothetical protein ZOSMA_239G00060 [Zostera marina]